MVAPNNIAFSDKSDIKRKNQPSYVRENITGPTAFAILLVCLMLAIVFITVVTMAK